MKFTNEVCPKCQAHELEVYNSLIDHSTNPATGYIFFVCEQCGNEFEVIKIAEVNT
jgi:DNA-directed RNA polymerase subunit M/transcription elongation factor TFIIS